MTSFLFKTHPASMVYGGPIVCELEDAPVVMQWFRDFQPNAPAELYFFLGLRWYHPATFSHGPLVEEDLRSRLSHNRPLAEGEKAVNAVRAALPKPIIDWAGPMPGDHPDPVRRALPKGLQWYWKGDFVKTSPDAAVAARIAHAAKTADRASCMHLYPIDGAVQRQKRDATARGYRDVAWSMVIFGVDPDPANAPALKKWARDYWEAVHPFNLAGAYANFMMDDEARCVSRRPMARTTIASQRSSGNLIRQTCST